jgi:hypothetical protein
MIVMDHGRIAADGVTAESSATRALIGAHGLKRSNATATRYLVGYGAPAYRQSTPRLEPRRAGPGHAAQRAGGRAFRTSIAE